MGVPFEGSIFVWGCELGCGVGCGLPWGCVWACGCVCGAGPLAPSSHSGVVPSMPASAQSMDSRGMVLPPTYWLSWLFPSLRPLLFASARRSTCLSPFVSIACLSRVANSWSGMPPPPKSSIQIEQRIARLEARRFKKVQFGGGEAVRAHEKGRILQKRQKDAPTKIELFGVNPQAVPAR